METLKRCITGRHRPWEIRWHLALLAVVYWALVYLAYRGYSTGGVYSVMTHTLSALGSFDKKHNPEYFWLFSVAMIYCGLVMIPVIVYIRRRLAVVSETGAWIGSLFFLLGCVGIILTGVFPDAGGEVIGDWRWRDIHMLTAGSIAVGFGIGFLWYWCLLVWDMVARGTFSEPGKLPYLKLMGPFSVCLPIFLAIGYRLEWRYLYAALYATFQRSEADMHTYWDLVEKGFRSFPVLEHLAIWGLTAFVIWLGAVVPNQED